VEAAKAQRRKPDHEPDQRCPHRCRGEVDRKWQAQLGHEHGREGAHRQEGAVADGDQSGRAHQEVQGDRADHGQEAGVEDEQVE
jgi:hypothetical protein